MFKDKKSPIPKGIRTITGFAYLGIIAIIFIFVLAISPTFENDFLKAFQFSIKAADLLSPIFILIDVIGIVGLTLVLIGFKKRGLLYWKIGWIFFAYASISNLISVIINLPETYFILHHLKGVFYVLFSASFAWYIYSRKDYYTSNKLAKEFPKDLVEKRFNWIIWILIILFMVGLQGEGAYEIYLTIKTTNLLGETRFHTAKAIEACKQYEGNIRDYCLYSLIDVHRVDHFGYNKDFTLTADICYNIDNPKYHDLCQVKFLNCDAMKQEINKQVCLDVLEEARKKQQIS